MRCISKWIYHLQNYSHLRRLSRHYTDDNALNIETFTVCHIIRGFGRGIKN